MDQLATKDEKAPAYGVVKGFTGVESDLILSAMALVESKLKHGPALNQPSDIGRYLALRFAGLEHEVFVGLMLDTQHRLIEAVELSRGTIDAASVYPREVVKSALANNAAAVVFAHNHPSGMPEPSGADRLLTERLQQALKLVDVRTLDHFVIGGSTWVSFAERGWL